jgi:geranylgeranyl diphosphate synthase type I
VVLPGITQIREAIDSELLKFTRVRAEQLHVIDSHLAPVADALTDFITDGGKRFRPIFAYLGYLGTGAAPSEKVLRACAALELVHVCALIHDDVMDGSDTRRNKPALHKRFEKLHRTNGYAGESEKFGVAAAILLGDLALSWSDEMLSESGLSSADTQRAAPLFYEMRAELMAGQYLDVLEGAIATSHLERSRKIARFKSGKYSIERPLQFGAALAGKFPELQTLFSNYGLPLGEAFQLRDDILGVFGDSALTGKPAGDDIREGKRTVLMALAASRMSDTSHSILKSALGNPNLDDSQVAQIQELVKDSGALAECEKLIEQLLKESLHALEHPALDTSVAKYLREMAVAATDRKS